MTIYGLWSHRIISQITCVLSEFTRRKPDENGHLWVNSVDEGKIYISAIIIGEIQRGIERLPALHQKTEFLGWMNSALVERFDQRILPFETETMFLWGSLTARLEAFG